MGISSQILATNYSALSIARVTILEAAFTKPTSAEAKKDKILISSLGM